MMTKWNPTVAVIGGSGMYRLPGGQLLDSMIVDTPFGLPSAAINLVSFNDQIVAFLPRHGAGHRIAPQQINHRANLWALASLGVRAVISSAAVGSLVAGQPRGSFSVISDFFDRTWGRLDTYYDGQPVSDVQHLSAADAYCPRLRALLTESLEELAEPHQTSGVLAVINGPRFSSPAESAWLSQAGAELISMTQYPEPVLAAELNLGYASLAYITDADTGHDGSEPVSATLVMKRLKEAQPRIQAVLGLMVQKLAADYHPRELISSASVNAVLSLPVPLRSI